MLRGKSFIEKDLEWRDKPDSISYRSSKSIFIGLVTFGTFIIVFLGFFFWYIPSVGLVNIHPALPIILGIGLSAIILILIAGAAGISLVVIKGRDIFFSYKLRGILIKFFLPLIISIGGLLRIPKIRIEQSFLDINNLLVKGLGKRFKPERILILMPHCIQHNDCKVKVTQNINNCVSCGKCEISQFIGLSKEFGIDLFVSTGGTIARRKIYEKKPDAVIAIACERDLTSGISDAYPLPVFAVVNKRPNGYCVSTGVEMKHVHLAVRDFLAK